MSNAYQQLLILIIDTNWPQHLTIDYLALPSSISSTSSKISDKTADKTIEAAKTGDAVTRSASKSLSFKDMLDALCMFIRAFELLADSRRLAIIAMNSKRCGIIYEGRSQNYFVEASGKRFADLNEKLWAYVEIFDENFRRNSILTSALSIGLCYMNRIQKESPKLQGQILIIDLSYTNSYSSQYIPLMNAAFTASKHDAILDVCALTENPSSILEQLVDITGGVYVNFTKCLTKEAKLELNIALSELMLFHFLPSKNIRNVVSTIKSQDKANTAVCFCHHEPIELCVVCSCCLAIYCSETDDNTGKERSHCSVCKTRFTRSTIQEKTTGGVLF